MKRILCKEILLVMNDLPKWALKCFTNSIPSSSFFFQNFTWPSALAVTRKSVLKWIKGAMRPGKKSNSKGFPNKKLSGPRSHLRSHGDVGDYISVHIAYFIGFCTGKIFKVNMFILQDWKEISLISPRQKLSTRQVERPSARLWGQGLAWGWQFVPQLSPTTAH